MQVLKLKKTAGYPTSNMNEMKIMDESVLDKPLYRTILDANSENMDVLAGVSSHYRLTYGDLFRNIDRLADVLSDLD